RPGVVGHLQVEVSADVAAGELVARLHRIGPELALGQHQAETRSGSVHRDGPDPRIRAAGPDMGVYGPAQTVAAGAVDVTPRGADPDRADRDRGIGGVPELVCLSPRSPDASGDVQLEPTPPVNQVDAIVGPALLHRGVEPVSAAVGD